VLSERREASCFAAEGFSATERMRMAVGIWGGLDGGGGGKTLWMGDANVRRNNNRTIKRYMYYSIITKGSNYR